MDEKVNEILKRNKPQFWVCKIWCFSLVIIGIGIIVQVFIPTYVEILIFKNLQIRTDASSFSEWMKPSEPTNVDVYIFNWTNPNDITDRSTIPKFKQIGPYKFHEYPFKYNITFHNKNSSVSYKKSSTFFFNSNNSNRSLDDMLNVLNILAITAASKIHHHSPMKQVGLSTSLQAFNQQVHVIKTARQMLFEGYSDIMVTLGAIFTEEAQNFDKIGFLVKRNGSDVNSGKISVNTGVEDISKLGQIEKFNNVEELPYFTGKCKKLKGFVSDKIPPSVKNLDVLHIFISDVCRSLPFEYDKDVKVHGITGRRYVLGQRAIDNGTLYAENLCFLENQFPSGAINTSACSTHQPTFVSYPHFYLADPSFSAAVDGMSPEKYIHESYIIIEPLTSTILESAIRLQNNILMRRSETISIYKKVPNMLVPLFIVDQKFTVDTENARTLKLTILLRQISSYMGYSIVTIGMTVIIIATIFKIRHNRNIPSSYNEMQLLVN